MLVSLSGSSCAVRPLGSQMLREYGVLLSPVPTALTIIVLRFRNGRMFEDFSLSLHLALPLKLNMSNLILSV
jgi:hypothetical protein